MNSIENPNPRLVDNHVILDEETRCSQITEYLLNRESQNKNPPPSGFERIRGIFEIQFQTEQYKLWWRNGYKNVGKMANDAIYKKYKNKYFNMYLEEHESLNEIFANDGAKQYLLKRENEKMAPPTHDYNDDRNFFPIPFRTEEYRQWWTAGPAPLESLEGTRPIYSRTDLRNTPEAIKLWKEKSEKLWELRVKYYLLYRESRNKIPPKWRYNNLRGKFEVPFETETYKQWWDSGAKPSEDTSDSDCSNHSDDYLNPKKFNKYREKWATRHLLSREASISDPWASLPFENRITHGSFEIPFQSLKYLTWWNHPYEFNPSHRFMVDDGLISFRQQSLRKCLLGYELLNLDPPRRSSYYGGFDIPFKTEKFRDWWNTMIPGVSEPNRQSKLDSYIATQTSWIVECFNDLDGLECDYREWLTRYLLDLESNGKTLPNSTFSGERGRFEIPFETESFRIWWND